MLSSEPMSLFMWPSPTILFFMVFFFTISHNPHKASLDNIDSKDLVLKTSSTLNLCEFDLYSWKFHYIKRLVYLQCMLIKKWSIIAKISKSCVNSYKLIAKISKSCINSCKLTINIITKSYFFNYLIGLISG